MLRLPDKMEQILLLVHGRGLREIDVAEKLGISKQAVSKSLREGRGRLSQLFLHVAELLNADIVRASLEKGCAVLKSRQLKRKIYVIYVPGKGLRTLFEGEIDCSKENQRICSEIVEAGRQWGLLKETRGALEKLVRDLIDLVES